MSNNRNHFNFNLEDRLERFSIKVIALCKSINNKDYISMTIAKQLIRSATSIGANYMEANASESKKDFLHKISLCQKEARESKYWLKLLLESDLVHKERIKLLHQESHEFTLIFGKIIHTLKIQMKLNKKRKR